MYISPKNKQALIVGGILGTALLVIIVYMGFMFVRDDIAQKKTQTETKRTELRAAKQKLAQYQAYLQDENTRRQVQEAFFQVASRLPDSQDPIEIYELFRDYLEGTDVALSFLEPGSSTRRERFTEYPYTIRGSARYHEFGQFVNLIECNPQRLMRVTNFKLTNNEKRPSIHPMEVGITTFTFNEN
jgi:Tfp pilus assembly protein PilO